MSNPSLITLADPESPAVSGLEAPASGAEGERANGQQELERLRVVAATVGDAVLLLDAEGRIDALNPAAERLTGWCRDDAKGSFLLDLVPILDALDEEITLDAALRPGDTLNLDESSMLERRGGDRIPVEGSITPVWSPTKTLDGLVVVLRDVGDRQRLAQRLARASSYDTLTGLLNREGFDLHLQESFERRLRSQGGDLDVLCHMDLDQFKVVNDTCGHAAGDMLMQWTASLIRERLGRGDVLGRVGGDEFGLLIRDTSLEKAMALADEIHSALAIFRFIWQDASFQVGTSLGMVPVTPEHEDAAQLYAAAERACYLAKQQGRGRTQLYRSDADEVVRHQGQMDWVVRLRQALDEGLFELHWQRIVPMRPVVADAPLLFEVLLRLRRRDGTLHHPGEFIPAAERFGLMPEIDVWVVSHLLRLLARQRPEFLDQLGFCTINLSGASVGRPEVLRKIEHELEHSSVSGEKLCFEITETAAVSNLESAVTMIERLHRRRCKWALDDFGAGMASYGYLQQLPVDFVKIDGNIVADVIRNPLSKAVVRSIHDIAHVMDARTIAEFVESPELWEALVDIGLDFAQGFHIDRPRKIEVNERLEDHSDYL